MVSGSNGSTIVKYVSFKQRVLSSFFWNSEIRIKKIELFPKRPSNFIGDEADEFQLALTAISCSLFEDINRCNINWIYQIYFRAKHF